MFLHTFTPNPILLEIGPIKIFWYGLFVVMGILSALLVALRLAGQYKLSKEAIIDSVFYIVIFGIIGARCYHILLELPYYLENPTAIFKIWQGGIAIHGALIGGLTTAWFFARKRKIDFWLMLAVFAPGVALGQAIGRWGNYFNQELYGLPTTLPWGIPIEMTNRPLEYYLSAYFHPTFLYESLGSLGIFLILIVLHQRLLKAKSRDYRHIVLVYFFLYSLLRFFTEFIRIDPTPILFGLRLPQLVSLLIMAVCLVYCILIQKKKRMLAV